MATAERFVQNIGEFWQYMFLVHRQHDSNPAISEAKEIIDCLKPAHNLFDKGELKKLEKQSTKGAEHAVFCTRRLVGSSRHRAWTGP
jgi:hypothetical protein